MQPQKFENEVQRKMHDLEFVPSEAVWENVLRSVGRRPRRRMVAAFWWWLGPGLVLLAAGGGIYLRTNSRHAIVSARPAATPVQGAVAGARGGHATDAAGVKRAVAGASGAQEPDAGAGADATNGGSADTRLAGAEPESKIGVGAVSARRAAGRTAGAVSIGRAARRMAGAVFVGGAARRATGTVSVPGGAGSRRASDVTGSFAGLDQGAGTVADQAHVHQQRYRPGLIGGIGSRSAVTATAMYPTPVNPAVSGIRQPMRPWRAGLAGGAGAASVEGMSGGGRSGYAAGNFFSYGGTAPGAAGGGVSPASAARRYAARISPDLSYRIGVLGEKPLSARWAVEIGLDLHYYSERLLTDEQIGGYSSASLLQSTAVTYSFAAQGAAPVENEQTYLNRYFFLEMPVSAQWQINRSRMLPVFWRAGAVLSYLMASNAVYYDSKTGQLSTDNMIARRAQASLQTGLMVGFPVKGVEFQAGPELQYAVTGLQRNNASGGHLVYGGMRIAVIR